MAHNALAGPVVLMVPAAEAFLRIVRATVATYASILGFSVDRIDDLRIAADELSYALVVLGKGTTVTVELRSDQHRLTVHGSCPAGQHPRRWEDDDRFTLSRQILSVVAPGYELRTEDQLLHFEVTQRRGVSTAR